MSLGNPSLHAVNLGEPLSPRDGGGRERDEFIRTESLITFNPVDPILPPQAVHVDAPHVDVVQHEEHTSDDDVVPAVASHLISSVHL